jgi:monothiol glutaredoxin
MTQQSYKDKIESDIHNHKVVLYMKGTADFPVCGFSSVVVQILHKLSVDFKDINVLPDPELRQAIKDYSNWPTIPQLYINGNFIGGCDIVKDMFTDGELQALLTETEPTKLT